VRQIVERVAAYQEGLTVNWQEGVEVPSELEPLAQSVLLEALRNADKHAEPGNVTISVERSDGTFALEVVNDGVGPAGMGTGLGLRMASLEALEHSGIVEFGPVPPDRWHVRLLVPTGDDD
jgi:signal transduction histidine kinase